MAITTLIPGENIVGQLGSGLGEMLTGLAAGKIKSMAEARQQQQQQQQQQQGFEQLGLDPQQAQAIASLPPQLQQLVLKDILSAPREQAYAEALGLGQLQPQQPQMALSPLQQLELLQGKMPEGLESLQAMPQMSQAPRLSERQATELAKLRREEQKTAQKEKAEAFKYNKKQIKDITEKAKSARQAISDLNRMEELQSEGKLDTPGYVEFLKKSGLDIPALQSEGSGEFNKIAQNFLRNAKQYYGGRVSNFEVEQFLKTIPSLSQSPEGRKRVIANLKNISRMELEYNKALRDIIKENKGIPPFDLSIQIDDRVEKQAKNLAKKFKEDLKKKVPEAQNRYVAALQSVLGSTLGTAGSAISKAAPAALGYLAGGVPGAIGAAGGQLLSSLASLAGK